ncbi:MAG: hypothetical protein HQL52_11105 [Magnetococcales bacterium]|nr:hypothetical protein [Magnetococcales bacterium]
MSDPITPRTGGILEFPAGGQGQEEKSILWEGKQAGFGDLLDTVNPLQHLPVVSQLYRQNTGDNIGNLPKLLGGTLVGTLTGNAPMAAVSAVADILVKESSGRDVGENILALVTPPTTPRENYTVVGSGVPTANREAPGTAGNRTAYQQHGFQIYAGGSSYAVAEATSGSSVAGSGGLSEEDESSRNSSN